MSYYSLIIITLLEEEEKTNNHLSREFDKNRRNLSRKKRRKISIIRNSLSLKLGYWEK